MKLPIICSNFNALTCQHRQNFLSIEVFLSFLKCICTSRTESLTYSMNPIEIKIWCGHYQNLEKGNNIPQNFNHLTMIYIFRLKKKLYLWILIVSKLPFDDRLQRLNQLGFSRSRYWEAVLTGTVKWSLLLTSSSPFNLVPNKHNSWNEDLLGEKKGKFLNK